MWPAGFRPSPECEASPVPGADRVSRLPPLASEKAVARMVDNYRYFKIGASWGGFEGLVVPADPAAYRTAVPWEASGYLLRYHVGLEDPEDLISDLAKGFQRLH